MKTPLIHDYLMKAKTNKTEDTKGNTLEPTTEVFVREIKRVHPKICVVMTGIQAKLVELTLALSTEAYYAMIKLVKQMKANDTMVFLVNNKGYVTGWTTQAKWAEKQAPWQQPQKAKPQ